MKLTQNNEHHEGHVGGYDMNLLADVTPRLGGAETPGYESDRHQFFVYNFAKSKWEATMASTTASHQPCAADAGRPAARSKARAGWSSSTRLT
jgi:hypothetical protein